MIFQHLFTPPLGPPGTARRTLHLHPISRNASEFGNAWGIIKRNLTIPTPPNQLYTKTTPASHSPKCDRVIWGNTVTVIVPLEILKRHTITTSHLLLNIRNIKGIIKTKTFDRFLEGLFVIEGQPHLNPHQNYRWCDALAK